MSSLQEQIQARMLAVVLNATDAGASVSRSRETFMARDVDLAIGIFPGDEHDSSFGGNADRHELIVSVCVFARGDPWYTPADGVVSAAHRLLMKDEVLLGMVANIGRISRVPVDDEADLTAGEYRMEYRITYLTQSSDIADGNIL